jgi:murein DD-endopeptidase MepM/ murein hydrolase activator NlpD
MTKLALPLIFLLGLSILLFPVQSEAVSGNDQINQEIEKIKQRMSQEKSKAGEIDKEIQRVQQDQGLAKTDLATILKQVEATAEALVGLNEQISSTTAELRAIALRLDEMELKVASREELLKARLRMMYTDGFVPYLDVLLSSTSFPDFLDRYEALKSILEQDKKILEANQRDMAFIAERKQEINAKLVQVERLYTETERSKSNLLMKENEKEVMVASLKNKEEALEGISEEQERKLMELAGKEAALLRKKSAAVPAKAGKLLWPLPKKYPLTSSFGTRVDPITRKPGEFHSGLDIGAPSGTSILAAESGTVIVAQFWSGYGNTVVVDHGNGLWTLYPHIRMGGFKVEKGDLVKKGQLLAEVGSTGRSTGPHLHFEVRLNERAVNPSSYLN